MREELLRALLAESARLQYLHNVAKRSGRDEVAAEIRKAGEVLAGVVGKLGRRLEVVP